MGRALWVRLAAVVALTGLCDPVLAQDVKGADPVRRQAEELAEEASKRFGEVLKAQAPEPKPAGAPTSPAGPETSLPLLLYWLDYSDHEYRGIMRRLALEGAERGWDPATIGWLKRSSQQFQNLMQRLAGAGEPPRPSEAVAQQAPERNSVASAAPSAPEPAMPPALPSEPAAVPGEAGAQPPAPAVEAPREAAREQAAASPPGDAAGANETAESAAAKPAPALAAEAAPTAARPLQPSREEAAREPAKLDKAGDPELAEAAPAPPASPVEARSDAAKPDKTADLGAAEAPAPGAAGAPAPQTPARSEVDANPATPPAASDLSPGEAPHPRAKSEALSAADAVKTSDARAGASRPEPAAPPPQAPGSDGATARLGVPVPDRPALNPIPPGAGLLAPGQRPAATAPSGAPAARQASMIAKPADGPHRRRTDKGGLDRCQTAGASVPLPGWYVVKRGDTLWSIAERHYGAGRHYRSIFAANRGRLKRGPDFILPCQQLYLPRQRRRGL